MPVYNAVDFVGEAIQSVIDQTYRNYKFIIIDDCSTDGSQTVIKNYIKKDKRIIFLKNNTNVGVVKSLNLGLRLADGGFIARIDADDIWLPNKLEKQIRRMMVEPTLGLLGTAKMLIDEKGEPITKKNELKFFNNTEIRRNILKHNLFCHSSVIYRSEVIKKIGYYNEEFHNTEDYEFWIRIISKYDVEILKEPLVYYRIYPGMISLMRRKEQIKYVIKAKFVGFKLIGFKPIYLFFLLRDVIYIAIPDWSIRMKKQLLGK